MLNFSNISAFSEKKVNFAIDTGFLINQKYMLQELR